MAPIVKKQTTKPVETKVSKAPEKVQEKVTKKVIKKIVSESESEAISEISDVSDIEEKPKKSVKTSQKVSEPSDVSDIEENPKKSTKTSEKVSKKTIEKKQKIKQQIKDKIEEKSSEDSIENVDYSHPKFIENQTLREKRNALIDEKEKLNKEIKKIDKQIEDNEKKINKDYSKHISKKMDKKPRKMASEPIKTEEMAYFIEEFGNLKNKKGEVIYPEVEKNDEGTIMIPRSKLVELIWAYIKNEHLDEKGKGIRIDEQLGVLADKEEGEYLENKQIMGLITKHIGKN